MATAEVEVGMEEEGVTVEAVWMVVVVVTLKTVEVVMVEAGATGLAVRVGVMVVLVAALVVVAAAVVVVVAALVAVVVMVVVVAEAAALVAVAAVLSREIMFTMYSIYVC